MCGWGKQGCTLLPLEPWTFSEALGGVVLILFLCQRDMAGPSVHLP